MRNIPVNSLSLDMRRSVLDSLLRAHKDDVNALIIFGEGKGFSAGADISEFPRKKHLQTPVLKDVVAALEESDIPVVAGIHGYCLGGALELALACHYRLADRSAKMGFPEVNIGLIPGAGGTQRLPRIVGPKMALDMCIYGKSVSIDEAYDNNLVDGVLRHDMSKIVSAHDSDLSANFAVQELTEFALARAVEGKDALRKRKVSEILPEHIPGDTSDAFWLNYHADHVHGGHGATLQRSLRGSKAPAAAFRAVQVACKIPSFETGVAMERRAFDELALGAEARSLQYAFFGDKKMREARLVVKALNGLKEEGRDALRGDLKVPGVDGAVVSRVKALWAVAENMVHRYGREVALLVGSGQVTSEQVDEALCGIVGMPHKPSKVVEALGLHVTAASASVGGGHKEDTAGESLGAAEVIARCLFPFFNVGLDALLSSLDSSGSFTAAVEPDELDAVFRHAHLLPGSNSPVFPRFRGGPIFYAENDVGLRDVMSSLKAWHEADESRAPSVAPSQLLVDTVQACSTLREELYFRQR